ncbi:MAG: cell wall-binding repeat-containing protein, partial [Acidimicrobiia bacterium]
MQLRQTRLVAAVVVALLAQAVIAVGPAVPARAEVPTAVERLAGGDRIETAIAVSKEQFPAGADAAVLARADDFADALAGGPLAADLHGPLLLTGGGELDSRVAAELQRVVPPGGAVRVLGGGQALSASVEASVIGLGFAVQRIHGGTRYETAVAIADAIDPESLIIATGTNFPDALSGGA